MTPWLLAAGVCILIPLAGLFEYGSAETLVGNPQIVDGDTIHFNRAQGRVRLLGVDAPELRQQCSDAAGNGYHCGQSAKAALAAFVGSRAVLKAGSEAGMVA